MAPMETEHRKALNEIIRRGYEQQMALLSPAQRRAILAFLSYLKDVFVITDADEDSFSNLDDAVEYITDLDRSAPMPCGHSAGLGQASKSAPPAAIGRADFTAAAAERKDLLKRQIEEAFSDFPRPEAACEDISKTRVLDMFDSNDNVRIAAREYIIETRMLNMFEHDDNVRIVETSPAATGRKYPLRLC